MAQLMMTAEETGPQTINENPAMDSTWQAGFSGAGDDLPTPPSSSFVTMTRDAGTTPASETGEEIAAEGNCVTASAQRQKAWERRWGVAGFAGVRPMTTKEDEKNKQDS
eukprot:gene23351-30602_t